MVPVGGREINILSPGDKFARLRLRLRRGKPLFALATERHAPTAALPCGGFSFRLRQNDWTVNSDGRRLAKPGGRIHLNKEAGSGMDQLTHEVLAFITAHPELAALLIGLTAFGESFAVISFLIPGTTILVAAGTLVTKGVLDPLEIAVAAAIGAILGDAISYWIGLKFGHALPNHWPFKTHRATLERGVHFFQRFGWLSIFIGRFLGPLRAFVPLVAGMCRMPTLPFYTANILSAVIWAPSLLYSGYLLGLVFEAHWSPQEKALAIAAAVIVAVAAAALTRRLFHHHAR